MISASHLAWIQLSRERLRLLVALAGVAFAVVLVFMQLGFHDALFTSAVAVHERLDADIFLINPQSHYLATMKTFSRRLAPRCPDITSRWTACSASASRSASTAR